MSKVLAFLYNFSDKDNQALLEPDEKLFFERLVNLHGDKISIRNIKILRNADLFQQIELLVKDPSAAEIYLHFSSHGAKTGITFNEWEIKVQDFGNILVNPKIKLCFFAACTSIEIAKEVSKQVAVTIGSSFDIGNLFTIEFQKSFYDLLFSHHTFGQAFHLSLTKLLDQSALKTIIENKGFQEIKDLVRSNFDDDKIEGKINDLHILYNKPIAKDRYLLSPTFEHLVSNDKAVKDVFIYWQDDLAIGDVEKEFIRKGYDEKVRIYALRTEDILELDAMSFMALESYTLKFCFLISNVVFSSLIVEFMRRCGFSGQDFIDFRVYRVKNKNDFIEYPALVKEVVKDPLKRLPNNIKNLDHLMASDDFDRFINKSDIQLSKRKNVIFKFPFEPSKGSIRSAEKQMLHLFLINPDNEMVIDYLINYNKKVSQYFEPVIIIETSINNDVKPIDALQERLILRLNVNKSLHVLMEELLNLPRIIFIRFNNNTSAAAIKSFVEELKQPFEDGMTRFLDGLNEEDRIEKEKNFKPVLFFISSKRLKNEDLEAMQATNISLIRNPNEIDASIQSAWASKFEDDDLEMQLFKNSLEGYKFEDNNKHPTKFIVHACEKLKVPPGQIIKVS